MIPLQQSTGFISSVIPLTLNHRIITWSCSPSPVYCSLIGRETEHVSGQKKRDLWLSLCIIPSQLLFQAAGTVPLQVGLLAFSLPLALLLGIDLILLLVFDVLLGSLPGEHLSLHCDVHAAFLGHKEIFDLPGHTAIPQHEDDPVGAHHEPAGGQFILFITD